MTAETQTPEELLRAQLEEQKISEVSDGLALFFPRASEALAPARGRPDRAVATVVMRFLWVVGC